MPLTPPRLFWDADAEAGDIAIDILLLLLVFLLDDSY